MKPVDLLSDTIYRQQAVKQLSQLLGGASEFPVKASQVYGLRQIARQEPEKVKDFAERQGKRALRKQRNVSKLQNLKDLQAEIDFWILVFDLCSDNMSGYSRFNINETATEHYNRVQNKYEIASDREDPESQNLRDLQAEIDFWTSVRGDVSATDWSVPKEGHSHLPEELQNIPSKKSGMQQEERARVNLLINSRKESIKTWDNEHIPTFFERFCTHCLYCIAKAEMGQLGGEDTDETHQQTQQEQSEGLGQEAMHAAFQQANLNE